MHTPHPNPLPQGEGAKEEALRSLPRPLAGEGRGEGASRANVQPLTFFANASLTGKLKLAPRERSVIRLPSYEQVKSDPVLYAHASRVLHLETCLLYTSPSPRDRQKSRMPSSA